MYEQFWHLNEKPFQNTPDSRYLYLSTQHEDALMKLSYVVAQDLGCGMLTGIFGCGKTLLGKVILNGLGRERYSCAFINNPSVSEPAELLRSVVRSLSPQALPEKKSELMADSMLEKLDFILKDNIKDGKKNMVIIDEAHSIEDNRTFEQMRLLLNFQLENKFMLTLLILGQPELKDKILNIKPLDQRIAVRCYLGQLNEEDVAKYISHRLKVAGRTDSPDNLFDKEAIKAIVKHSAGIPRRINTVCDLALMTGFAKKTEKVSADLIETVIKDFGIG
ncbi:MAG: AAA family ATPase [Candidatus Omnitrophota bacterium]|nr:AAA family ATPase [Candidatus Omnitrophota bacterium]